MTPRTTHLLGLGALVTLALLALWRLAPPAASTRLASILETLPPNASLVASFRVEPLRRAGLLPRLVESTAVGGGPDSLAARCGFDPLDSADVAAIFIESRHDGELDFGLAALGDFAAPDVLDCAAKMVTAREGDPRVSRIGTFHTVRDGNGREGEVAVRDGGPLLLGGASSLRAMIDAVEGHSDSMVTNTAHAALRRSVGPDHAVVASWIASPATREALDGRADGLAPLAGIRAAAFGMSPGPDGMLEVHLVVGAESATAALLLARWLDEAAGRAGVTGGPALRIDGVQITGHVRIPLASARAALGLDGSGQPEE